MATSTIQANKHLLWTNANPSSAFAEQDVTVNWSGYEMLEILYRPNTTGDITTCHSATIVPVENQSGYIFDTAGSNVYRAFTMKSNYIHFTSGYYYAGYGGTSPAASNNMIVPYKIYGITNA